MRHLILFISTAILAGCTTLPPMERVFVIDAQTAPAIVVAADAPAPVNYAARELQHWLQEMTGATLAIQDDRAPLPAQAILLGPSRYTQDLRLDAHAAGAHRDGYVLRTVDDHLWIEGHSPRGTLYGVYGLLEDHLGCRWFTPEATHIPRRERVILPVLDETVNPVLEYREPFTMDCFDGDWAARNRMNGNAARLEEKHGGKVSYFGFVHTFDQLLPPDQYFDEHPEYFSLVKGERLRDRTQLCCTNEEVVALVTEEVRKRMREHPEAMVFSVSQNDWYNYCECDNCTALAEAEGTQAAPVLHLVNSVARAVANEFPDKAIDTLAYQYTRKPPKTMLPEPNVIIRLCSIECCFAHPFTTCDSPENAAFVEDVVGWGKISDRLWVWDYVTSFRNYFVPFPNLRVRGENIRFLEANNVTGIFEQDVYTTLNGEFSGLSGYLNAKLLWDPNYDENRAINEFLRGVYGAAATPLREYLDLIHDKVQDGNIHFDIWIDGSAPFLTEDLLLKAEALFNEAEAAVASDPVLLERVKVARLSLDYAMIELERHKGLDLYVRDNGRYVLDPAFTARVERFFEIGARNNVTALWEGANSIETYQAELDALVLGPELPPRAAVAVSGLQPGLHFACYEGSWDVIPDFGALTPVEEGTSEEVSVKVTSRTELFGLRFSGFFHAPEDGLYMFHLSSNDGSRMYLGEDLFIDNDGLHRFTPRVGTVSLGKGYHPIVIEYFESSGTEQLELRVQGAGITPQMTSAQYLAHQP